MSNYFCAFQTVENGTGKVKRKIEFKRRPFWPNVASRSNAPFDSFRLNWRRVFFFLLHWIEFRPMFVSVCNVGDVLICIFAASRVQNGRLCQLCQCCNQRNECGITFSTSIVTVDSSLDPSLWHAAHVNLVDFHVIQLHSSGHPMSNRNEICKWGGRNVVAPNLDC